MINKNIQREKRCVIFVVVKQRTVAEMLLLPQTPNVELFSVET